MPKWFKAKHIVKVLENNGFTFISQTGSHAKYRSGEYMVIVPIHSKDLPVGTFKSIVRQSGLSKEDFE